MKTIVKNIFIVAAIAFPYIAFSQRSLSLQDAVQTAIDHNPDLKASQLEIQNSTQQQVIARSALLPVVQAAAQVNHYFKLNPFFGFGETATSDKIPYGRFGGEDQLTTVISAVQPIYNPQAFPGIKQAAFRTEEAKLKADAKRSSTLLLVKQAYLQTLLLNERIELQNESVRRNERVLQDSRSLFIQGKGLRVDTLRAYTAVRNLEPVLIKLKFARETSLLSLKTLLGIDSLDNFQLSDSLFLVDNTEIPSEEEVYNAARLKNPDYRLFDLQNHISEQQVAIASAARMPTVALVGQYQLLSQTNNFDYSKAYYPSASFVGLQLSVPIFNGLSTHAKVKQANLTKTETALRVNYAYDQLHASVHQVVANSLETKVRLETTAAVEETAKLSYGITEYRYKRGVSSRLELADASLELSTAQSNFIEAVYDYLIARIALQHLMGNFE